MKSSSSGNNVGVAIGGRSSSGGNKQSQKTKKKKSKIIIKPYKKPPQLPPNFYETTSKELLQSTSNTINILLSMNDTSSTIKTTKGQERPSSPTSVSTVPPQLSQQNSYTLVVDLVSHQYGPQLYVDLKESMYKVVTELFNDVKDKVYNIVDDINPNLLSPTNQQINNDNDELSSAFNFGSSVGGGGDRNVNNASTSILQYIQDKYHIYVDYVLLCRHVFLPLDRTHYWLNGSVMKRGGGGGGGGGNALATASVASMPSTSEPSTTATAATPTKVEEKTSIRRNKNKNIQQTLWDIGLEQFLIKLDELNLIKLIQDSFWYELWNDWKQQQQQQGTNTSTSTVDLFLLAKTIHMWSDLNILNDELILLQNKLEISLTKESNKWKNQHQEEQQQVSSTTNNDDNNNAVGYGYYNPKYFIPYIENKWIHVSNKWGMFLPRNWLRTLIETYLLKPHLNTTYLLNPIYFDTLYFSAAITGTSTTSLSSNNLVIPDLSLITKLWKLSSRIQQQQQHDNNHKSSSNKEQSGQSLVISSICDYAKRTGLFIVKSCSSSEQSDTSSLDGNKKMAAAKTSSSSQQQQQQQQPTMNKKQMIPLLLNLQALLNTLTITLANNNSGIIGGRNISSKNISSSNSMVPTTPDKTGNIANSNNNPNNNSNNNNSNNNNNIPSELTNGLKNVWDDIMNYNSLVAEMLAKHIDQQFRNSKSFSSSSSTTTTTSGNDDTTGGAITTTSSSLSSTLHSNNNHTNNIHIYQNSVIKLFCFLSSKDIFEAFYKKDLAKRLLLSKSFSMDIERNMVTLLKVECGAAFVSKMEGMFQDIDWSKETMLRYKQSNMLSDPIQDTTSSSSSNVDMEIQVLTTGYWPVYPQYNNIILPMCLQVPQNKFLDHYKSKYQGRRLTWQYFLGNCLLKYNIYDKKTKKVKQYDLFVSLLQTLVLMCFNNNDIENESNNENDNTKDANEITTTTTTSNGWTLPDIMSKIGLNISNKDERNEVERILQSLSLGKDGTRVLRKCDYVADNEEKQDGSSSSGGGGGIAETPSTVVGTSGGDSSAGNTNTAVIKKKKTSLTVSDKDIFVINTNFTSNMRRIKINNIQLKETKDEHKKTIETISRDRLYLIDAVIVRIMKSRKSITHQSLILQVLQHIKIPAQSSDIKNRIESLIEREYIERDKNDRNRYNYLA